MRKKFLLIALILLLVSSLPLSVSAFGGYFVVKGLNGYHSAMCENLNGYAIEQVKWYETLEKVKKTGLSPAACCSGTGSDYTDDQSSMWNSRDKKTDNIFEVERMWGVLDGYDAGVSDGYDEGYSIGHSDGIELGFEDGYNQGYAEGSKDESTYLLMGVAGFFFFFIGGVFHITHDHDIKKWEQQKKQEQIDLERSLKEKEQNLILETAKQIDAQKAIFQQEVQTEKVAIKQLNVQLNNLIKETKQSHPELAKQIADAQYYLDMRSYDQLLCQKRPALKAAEEVKKISGEKRQLMQENRQLQYQLDFYEKLFPWLEEFKEVPSDEAVAYATNSYGSEYDAVRKWISPEDFEKLSTTEKYQKILDRWKNRKKTDWDIGIEYERYIGYRLECEGYKVSYVGATLGLKDMGRDLIASKNGQTLIIQCKRWAKEKTIHEKHIFQLYGSVAVYATEHPGIHCKPVFITTTSLSETAQKCAKYCGITIVENCPMGDYPLIKCNANKDGEKIYHLPFDQQYDKVVISKNRQSCYAWTTKEAEEKGFRRAYRWRPNKS